MMNSDNHLLFATIVAIVLFLLLTLFNVALVFFYQKRRHQHVREMHTLKKTYEQTLLQSQIEVQEATFSALGKELHDNVGQLLSSTKMLLGVTERSLPTAPDTLITAQETLARAINELRSLSRSLTKEWLEQFNLIDNLQAEVARNNSANDLQIFLSSPQTLPVSPDKQIILFRIIQEALQNAIKHASPKNISICITEDNTAITTIIKDDGTGFEATEDMKGMGLMNMKQRTQLLNGSISWQSSPNEGTVINIVLPVNEHPQ
jgi:signal transduction histidine kinase